MFLFSRKFYSLVFFLPIFLLIFICVFFIPIFSKNYNFTIPNSNSSIITYPISSSGFVWPCPRFYNNYISIW